MKERDRGGLAGPPLQPEGGSSFTDKSRTVRPVVQISMPALNGVLEEGNCLLLLDDFTFE